MKQLAHNRHLLNAFKLALGLLLLYLSIKTVEWGILTEALATISPLWLWLAVLSVLLSLALKVWRWDVLLRNYQIWLPLVKLISAFFLGQAANILLIIRGGEVVRIGAAHQPEEDDWLAITATIAIEKYLDLLMLVVLMLISVNNLPPLAVEKLGSLRIFIILLTLILFLMVVFGPFLWQKFSTGGNHPDWFEKIQPKIDRFIQASLWLKDLQRLSPMLVFTIAIWVVMAVTNLLVFQSLSIQLNWDAAVLVLILIYLGVLPALMPGNIGPFTFFAQLALIPFAVENELALAFAIILYVIVTLPPLLLAGFMMLLPTKKKLRGTG